MSKFEDAIVEYKYFDNNLKKVTSRRHADVMIGRTDDRYFGRKWFAIDPNGHFNLGSGTVSRMKRLGSTKVISDAAREASIEFVDDGYTRHGNKKTRGIIVDGKRVGAFVPKNFGGAGYRIHDLSGEYVEVPGSYTRRLADADRQADFEMVVRKWLEIIPTQKQIDKREADLVAAKQAEEEEAAENRRVLNIKNHGEELLGALKSAEQYLVAWEMDSSLTEPTRKVVSRDLEKLRKAVANAEGTSE